MSPYDLGRVVAAEKNSAAAVRSADHSREEVGALQKRVLNLEQQIQQQAGQIARLNAMLAASMGTGSTEG